jgi:hypothetical protein
MVKSPALTNKQGLNCRTVIRCQLHNHRDNRQLLFPAGNKQPGPGRPNSGGLGWRCSGDGRWEKAPHPQPGMVDFVVLPSLSPLLLLCHYFTRPQKEPNRWHGAVQPWAFVFVFPPGLLLLSLVKRGVRAWLAGWKKSQPHHTAAFRLRMYTISLWLMGRWPPPDSMFNAISADVASGHDFHGAL